MYTQFFGNYLLNKNIITQEQLLLALNKQSKTHVKIGTLAIHAGYMTASEAEQIFIMQTHRDKRFGELAVEMGYMSDRADLKYLVSEKKREKIVNGLYNGIKTAYKKIYGKTVKETESTK